MCMIKHVNFKGVKNNANYVKNHIFKINFS